MKLEELKTDFQLHRIETKKAMKKFMANKTQENKALYIDARDARNECLKLIQAYK